MAPIRCCFDQTAVWHSDAARGPSTPSFDHLVGEGEEIVGDFQSEPPRGSQVDYQLEFGRLMDRQLRGLGPLQNLRGIDAVLAVTLGDAHTVTQESARDRIFTKLVDR